MAITTTPLGPNSASIVYDAGTSLDNLITAVGYYIAQHGWSPAYGTATGGGATSLIDTTKNFVTLGVLVGMSIIRTADNKVAVITSISTTTNPNDTLNYTAGGSTPTFGVGDVYDVIWDAAAGTNARAYRALNKDASTYKYAVMDYNTSGYLFCKVYESWDFTLHTGLNLVNYSNSTNYCQQINLTSGGSLWIFSHARYLIMCSKIGTYSGSTYGGSWCGCIEVARDNPEDVYVATVTEPYTNVDIVNDKILTATPFSNGTIVWYTGTGNSIGGLTAGNNYYVVGSVPATSFQLSLTLGGGALDLTSQGTGNALFIPTVPCWVWANGSIVTWGFPRMRDGTTGAVAGLYNFVSAMLAFGGLDTLTAKSFNNYIPTNSNAWNGKTWAMTMRIGRMGGGAPYSNYPELRGRLFGLKLLSKGFGDFLDDLFIKVDADFFYDPAGVSTEHWVLIEYGSNNNLRYAIPK